MNSPKHSCQCEHTSHFDKTKRTPAGRKGHHYNSRMATVKLVQTTYGPYYLCDGCEHDCLKEYVK